jgi:hypothetical protein
VASCGIYVLPSTAMNGCSLGLKPISFKSCRAGRLSFVFPLISRIVSSMLFVTFFSICMTSRLCRSKLSFKYGNLKKLLFFFHTILSSVAVSPFFRFFFFLLALSSLNDNLSNCRRISFSHGTLGAHSSSSVLSNVLLFSRHRYSMGKYLLWLI